VTRSSRERSVKSASSEGSRARGRDSS
jgi:hypothetical protein